MNPPAREGLPQGLAKESQSRRVTYLPIIGRTLQGSLFRGPVDLLHTDFPPDPITTSA